MKVILIGFRATGKTSVGRELANRLGLPFLDLDEYIVEKAGKSIAEIVEEKGWPYFRELEKAALYEMSKRDNLVLALGGGSVMHADEMDLLKANSSIIWLKALPEAVLSRLEKDEKTCAFRPSLTDKSLQEEVACILVQREPLYQRYADLIVETDHLTTEEVVEKIIEFLRRAGVV
ncbi:Shikimate kinase [Thermodesulfatator indicus DSM 15286]|uniref:Shikimate kinase n=1 Tax=Thermodesulfatator indicus (strain DSM 15286 / JCM 11887 / CIR29812) TaxID=667014 RepID=F8ACD8_THEID|nr:shikimate kinase [Thermodesulfatator indicus]AEH45778.1 Shikimate kinase [Thermodesulfatator indicus DSM 15286]